MPGTIEEYVAWTHTRAFSIDLVPLGLFQNQMRWEVVIDVPAMTLIGSAPLLTSLCAYKAKRIPESGDASDAFGEWTFTQGSRNLSQRDLGEPPFRGDLGSGVQTATNPNNNHERRCTLSYKRAPTLSSGARVTMSGDHFMGGQEPFPPDEVFPGEVRGVIAVALLHDLDGMVPQPDVTFGFPESLNYTPRTTTAFPPIIGPGAGIQISGPLPGPDSWVHNQPGPYPVVFYYAADSQEGGSPPPISTIADAATGWGDVVSVSAHNFSLLIGLAMPGATLPHPYGLTPGNGIYQGYNTISNFNAVTSATYAQVIG